MRIYLLHPDGTIAACETEESAARAETRGFERCSYEEWRDGWRRKDRRARAEADALKERSVGGGS